MGLFDDWKELAEAERSDKERSDFWNEYFDAETENYKKLLADYKNVKSGKVSDLASEFNMEARVFAGFIDGINTSLKNEIDLDSLTEESEIALDIDYEKLYFNMLDAKADWLYGLDEWDQILTEERRREITKEFRTSKIFVAEKHIGRNDPCPCGSGKKYKKCCGKNA